MSGGFRQTARAHPIQVKQDLLFEPGPSLPEGFIYKDGILSPAEEQSALEAVRALEFGDVRMHGVVARRRIAHFGLRYAFSSHHLSPAGAMPAELDFIRDRVAEFAGISPHEFQEILVTEYPPGAVIGWHRDAPPFGIIAGVSLGTPCRMKFRRGNVGRRQSASIELAPRSAYLLTGPARNEWEHSIPPISESRYSITFRTLKDTSPGAASRPE
jgi:DNA oxidative demethylase